MTMAVPQPTNPRRPRPASVPEPGTNVELVSKMERDRRRRIGPKTRLTQQVIDDIATALGTGAPLNFAADFVGIGRNTLAEWVRTGEAAQGKAWSSRTQMERRCIVLREAIREAQGSFALRLVGVQAQAAGLTKEKPTMRTTRRKIIGPTFGPDGQISGGEEVEVVIEERELAADWRAAVHLGKVRFPEELGDPQPEEPTPAGQLISAEMLLARVEQIKRDRELAEADESSVLDAEVIEPENPAGDA